MCQASVDSEKSLIHNLQTCFHDCGSLLENVSLTRTMSIDPEMDFNLAMVEGDLDSVRQQLLNLFSIEFGKVPQ